MQVCLLLFELESILQSRIEPVQARPKLFPLVNGYSCGCRGLSELVGRIKGVRRCHRWNDNNLRSANRTGLRSNDVVSAV